MALNWKEIKGFYKGSNNTMYTFIEFQDNATGEYALPKIYTNTSNSDSGWSSHGHILTSDDSQEINATNYFKSTQVLTVYSKLAWQDSVGVNECAYIKRDQYAEDGQGQINPHGSLDIWDLNFMNFIINSTTALTISASHVTSKVNSTFNAPVVMDQTLDVTGRAIFSNECRAYFFNATSDKRAKENILPLDFNALDLINRTQLYSFNYKANQYPSIGILAQDVQDVDINGFTLVDNINATGEQDDYMALRESKLVYILMKAIQELSVEVKELKSRLGE